jgi:hypothetical protein
MTVKNTPASAGAKNKKPPARPKTAGQGADTPKKVARKTAGVKTGKTPQAGKTAKPEDPKERLAAELCGLIPRLDAGGLQFLVEQARIHLYNMQVDELNRTLTRSGPAAVSRPEKQSDEIRVEGSASGSSFYLFYHGQSVMFSRDEIIALVKLVNGPGTALETAERLFNWFDRERADVFALIPMADKFDGRLKKIARLVRKNFKIQPKKPTTPP